MGDPLRELKQWEAAGQDVLLVLAVERDGPTPGASGAKMLVAGRGRFSGTIGGGRLELYCQERGPWSFWSRSAPDWSGWSFTRKGPGTWA